MTPRWMKYWFRWGCHRWTFTCKEPSKEENSSDTLASVIDTL